MVFSLAALVGLSLLGVSLAQDDIPCTSTCLLNSFPGEFCNPLSPGSNLALIPINLYPESEISGPTSLDAINFITLGVPLPSEFGDVCVETFSLTNGWLTEKSGLAVYFTKIDEFDGNSDGVCESSVLKAGECGGGCGGFCVDEDGYLVSVAPLGTSQTRKRTDLVTDDGSYESNRVKFYACPNEAQDETGGGDYKIYSNSVPDQWNCVPIYLGVKPLRIPLLAILT
jgi:hypothetical protein